MDRCTGHRDITEILLKTALHTIHVLLKIQCTSQNKQKAVTGTLVFFVMFYHT